MATIDKIYFSYEQYYEFLSFLDENIEAIIDETEIDPRNYVYEVYGEYAYAISNFPSDIDIWLIKNCDLPYVKERLNIQYPNKK